MYLCHPAAIQATRKHIKHNQIVLLHFVDFEPCKSKLSKEFCARGELNARHCKRKRVCVFCDRPQMGLRIYKKHFAYQVFIMTTHCFAFPDDLIAFEIDVNGKVKVFQLDTRSYETTTYTSALQAESVMRSKKNLAFWFRDGIPAPVGGTALQVYGENPLEVIQRQQTMDRMWQLWAPPTPGGFSTAVVMERTVALPALYSWYNLASREYVAQGISPNEWATKVKDLTYVTSGLGTARKSETAIKSALSDHVLRWGQHFRKRIWGDIKDTAEHYPSMPFYTMRESRGSLVAIQKAMTVNDPQQYLFAWCPDDNDYTEAYISSDQVDVAYGQQVVLGEDNTGEEVVHQQWGFVHLSDIFLERKREFESQTLRKLAWDRKEYDNEFQEHLIDRIVHGLPDAPDAPEEKIEGVKEGMRSSFKMFQDMRERAIFEKGGALTTVEDATWLLSGEYTGENLEAMWAHAGKALAAIKAPGYDHICVCPYTLSIMCELGAPVETRKYIAAANYVHKIFSMFKDRVCVVYFRLEQIACIYHALLVMFLSGDGAVTVHVVGSAFPDRALLQAHITMWLGVCNRRAIYANQTNIGPTKMGYRHLDGVQIPYMGIASYELFRVCSSSTGRDCGQLMWFLITLGILVDNGAWANNSQELVDVAEQVLRTVGDFDKFPYEIVYIARHWRRACGIQPRTLTETSTWVDLARRASRERESVAQVPLPKLDKSWHTRTHRILKMGRRPLAALYMAQRAAHRHKKEVRGEQLFAPMNLRHLCPFVPSSVLQQLVRDADDFGILLAVNNDVKTLTLSAGKLLFIMGDSKDDPMAFNTSGFFSLVPFMTRQELDDDDDDVCINVFKLTRDVSLPFFGKNYDLHDVGLSLSLHKKSSWRSDMERVTSPLELEHNLSVHFCKQNGAIGWAQLLHDKPAAHLRVNLCLSTAISALEHVHMVEGVANVMQFADLYKINADKSLTDRDDDESELDVSQTGRAGSPENRPRRVRSRSPSVESEQNGSRSSSPTPSQTSTNRRNERVRDIFERLDNHMQTFQNRMALEEQNGSLPLSPNSG